MTSLTAADDEEPTTRSLALVAPTRADTDSWTNVVVNVSRLAQEVAGTHFVPKGLRNDVPATTAAILYGREIGLPPMTALTQIHVIEGRPGISAEGMRALVLAAGHELVFDEATGALCRMRARRRGSQTWTPLTWTLDAARAAGLTNKDNWRSYPRAMLVARCTTDLCRMIFPDVIHGFRSIEELDDMDDAREAPDPESTSTVQRRTDGRKPRKRRATPEPAPEPAPTPPGPPLPGEEEDGGDHDAPAAGSESRPPAVGASSEPERPPVAPPLAPTVSSDVPGPRMVNRPTLRLVFREFNRLGIEDKHREQRLEILSEIAGRALTSSNDLTQEEGTRVLTMLSSVGDLDALAVLVALGGEVIEDTTAKPEPEPAAAAPEPDEPDEPDEPLPDPEEGA